MSDHQLGTTILLPVHFDKPDAEKLRLLRRALESIEEQNFPGPHEILIVDDGSSVPVEALCSQLGSPRLQKRMRVLRSDRNNGLVHALNRGLGASRFPFVARLDADDRWLPDKIERQFEQFLRDPDLTISATGMTSVRPSGEPLETHIRPGDWTGILNFFVAEGCPFPHGSILAKRATYRLLGGYSHAPETAHCEDYALWGIWLRFFKPAALEEALYDYTIHDQSISIRHSSQQQMGSTLVRERFRSVDAARNVPQALQALSGAARLTLMEAGILAYRMWRYRLAVRLPGAALAPLALLMPDRKVDATDDPHALALDRVLGRSSAEAAAGVTAIQIR